jgi:menaquinone-dependent protoporphyrinogen oxidase
MLIAYATIHGSTQEVAQAVAAELGQCGFETHLEQLKRVRSLDAYPAVVVGAPLYMFHWHKDARRFLARHRQALGQRRVAIFALGPMNDVEKEFVEARQQLDKELAKFPWLQPAAIQMFGGKFDPLHLRFPYNLIPALKQMPASDIRDWEAIRAWARSLSERL